MPLLPSRLRSSWLIKRPALPNYHARKSQELVGAIADGRKPLVDEVEGRRSVTVLLAHLRVAARRQRGVYLAANDC
jgi:hypothetical protein